MAWRTFRSFAKRARQLATAPAERPPRPLAIAVAVSGPSAPCSQVAAVRSALLRLFDGFVLHRGVPEPVHVELIGEC